MKKNIKIFFSLQTIIALVFGTVLPLKTLAYNQIWNAGIASGGADIDISQIVEEGSESAESRYGFGPDVLRTAKRKMSAPRVEIFFDNNTPKPGEKVTAHAIPEFFKNDPQNLYYTWYLIHTETKDSAPYWKATNNLKSGKIAAARILAAGDYDPNLDGQTYSNEDDDPDNDGWPPVDKNSYDSDITQAPFGGADGVGGLAPDDENIEPYDNADEYCDTLGKHGLTDCNLNTSKSSFNQYYNMQSDQTGDYCKACQSSLSFTSTLSPTGNPTASVNSPNNQCCYSVLYPDPDDPSALPYDPNVDYCPTSYDSTYESCYDYSGLQTYNSDLITTCLNNQYTACENDWNTLHANPTGDEPVSKVTRCYKHNFGVNSGAQGFRGYSGSTNSFSDEDSGTDVVVDCKHKWENAPEYKTGAGRFPTGEEKYWKTDPTSPSTNGNGQPDEANIIGLGEDSFSWNYQPGDRVGVVVEGTSIIPVDEKSAYYKIMWGYPDVCDPSKTSIMDDDGCDSDEDYGYGFFATKSPEEKEGASLKVSLSYSPDNPVADPSDDNEANIQPDGTISDADQITVTSSLDNTVNNPNNLYYTWQISKGDSPSAEDWTEIADMDGNFTTGSNTKGINIPNFTFSPKKNALSGGDDISYFKVTLTVSTAADITAGRGRSSVVIGVNKNGIKVNLYKVDVQDGKASIGEEVCKDGLYQTLCPAVQYQMLAAKVSGGKYTAGNSEFSWSLDGEILTVPPNASSLFDGWSSTAVFFPITKGEQEIEDISVTATPKASLAPVTGGRSITVVHPAAFVKPADTSTSWPTIYTVQNPDKKNNFETIEDQNNYQALAGKEISYYLDFVPDYLLTNDPLNTSIDWKINGASMSTDNVYSDAPDLKEAMLENDGKTLKLTTNGATNQNYSIGADIVKYWSDEERHILLSAWDITPDTIQGDTSINVITTSQPAPGPDDVWGTIGQGNSTQVLAAIGTHLSHYFMYVLRLALTLLVMFFLSAGLYALTQEGSLFGKE